MATGTTHAQAAQEFKKESPSQDNGRNLAKLVDAGRAGEQQELYIVYITYDCPCSL